MTANLPCIADYFRQIEDYRRDNTNRRHNIIDILIIALCAILCGCDDWVAIESYGKSKEEWFRGFLELPNGIPSHDTFNRIFSRIEPEQFLSCFLSWVKEVFPIMGKEVIAIDGKTLRRSHDKSKDKAAIHMVSAWATESNLVLGQVKTEEKSNEITAIPELIKRLSIENCLITIDAMGCQKEIAKAITQKNGDYLLAVKANQPKLFEAVQATFEGKSEKSYAKPLIDYFEKEEKNRDRHEKRKCWVTTSLCKFSQELKQEWPSVYGVAKVDLQRTADGKISTESRFYLLSCSGSAQEVLLATRSHWGIENKLHWTLDMAFREDECRVRKGFGAENLARLRHFALNLLKQDKTKKMGVKNKRLTAGWDNNYLLQLLNGSMDL